MNSTSIGKTLLLKKYSKQLIELCSHKFYEQTTIEQEMPTVVKVRALRVCVDPVGLTMGCPARVRDAHVTLELNTEVEIVLICITHHTQYYIVTLQTDNQKI